MNYLMSRHLNPDPAVDPATGVAVPANPAGGAAAVAVTFTEAQQKHIDAITGGVRKEATATARAAERADVLKELGVEKLEDAKTTIASHKTMTDAQKSEAQKQADERTALIKERDDARAATLDKQKFAEGVLMNSAIDNEALKQGVPAERLPAFRKLVERAGMSVKGEAVEGADAAVTAALKENDFFKGSAEQGSGVGTGKPGTRKVKLEPDQQKVKQDESRRRYRRTF